MACVGEQNGGQFFGNNSGQCWGTMVMSGRGQWWSGSAGEQCWWSFSVGDQYGGHSVLGNNGYEW